MSNFTGIVKWVLKGLGYVLLAALAIPLLVLILPFDLIIIVISGARDQLADRRFRIQHIGKVFVVCSRTRGWHEFLTNNVLPVLPQSWTPVWRNRRGWRDSTFVVSAPLRGALSGHRKPMLVLVNRRSYSMLSFHEDLLDLKPHARRSPQIQSQVQTILDAADREIREP